MSFNDQLHEDLFDLFVYTFINPFKGEIDDKLALFAIRNQSRGFHYLRDLFPLENHPEEFEGLVHAQFNPKSSEAHLGGIYSRNIYGNLTKKIKFRFVEDE